MAAELCPVCGGSGKYSEQAGSGTAQVCSTRQCHGCGGKGWVNPDGSNPAYIPWVPTPSFPPYYPYGLYPPFTCGSYTVSPGTLTIASAPQTTWEHK